MTTPQIAVAAMQAGLRGEKLPDLGSLTKEQVLLVNTVYDEARNWNAGGKVRARAA